MTRYYSDLTTREDVRDQLMRGDLDGTDPAPVNSEDADFVRYVDSAIHSMSRYIQQDSVTDRSFVPYKDTYSLHFNDPRFWREFWNNNFPQMKLREDLLVTSSLTWDSTLLSASYYREMPANRLPHD